MKKDESRGAASLVMLAALPGVRYPARSPSGNSPRLHIGGEAYFCVFWTVIPCSCAALGQSGAVACELGFPSQSSPAAGRRLPQAAHGLACVNQGSSAPADCKMGGGDRSERPARHQPPLWRAPAGLVWPPCVHHKAFDGPRPPRGRHGGLSPLL